MIKISLLLEDFNFDAPKTKNFTAVLKALDIQDKKSLFVLGDSQIIMYICHHEILKALKL